MHFLEWKYLNLNWFSLKFVPKGPINKIPALVQIMAWRRPGDKPLSEPMMVRLLTHICVTRPQWVNYFNSYIRFCRKTRYKCKISLALRQIKYRTHMYTRRMRKYPPSGLPRSFHVNFSNETKSVYVMGRLRHDGVIVRGEMGWIVHFVILFWNLAWC